MRVIQNPEVRKISPFHDENGYVMRDVLMFCRYQESLKRPSWPRAESWCEHGEEFFS